MKNNNNLGKKDSKSYGKGKPNHSKGKSRKSQSRKQSGESFDKDDVKACAGSINDSSYYYRDNNVMDQLVNFSFNQFGGVPIEWPANSDNQVGSQTITNIMVIRINPCIPQTDAVLMPGITGVTTAALRNYLVLSGSNAKTTNYAPQDVLLLQLALGEVIKTASFLSRILGTPMLFNYRNRDYPETLIAGQGIDLDDLKQNFANYKAQFNTLLALAAKIPFPAGIPYFAKCAEDYASYYLDSDNSALAQTYMFVPETTWLYDEQYNTQGGGLRTVQFVPTSGVVNFSNYLTIFRNMINALLNSTALNYIYSDILRLQQKGIITQFITFNSIPDNWIVLPVYNPEIETIIHNSFILGNPLTTSAQWGTSWTDKNDVESDASSNTVKYKPQFKMSSNFGFTALVDFRSDQVTSEMKVAATRLSTRCIIATNPGDNKPYTRRVAFLDQYITQIRMYTSSSNHILGESAYDPDALGTTNVYLTGTYAGMLSKFDWHPIWYLWKASDPTDALKGLIGDLNFYTLLDFDLLSRMYDYEVMNLYQID